ncbi:hypothetical protein EYF80_041769 [Liparis tanakae]|uniref:Uncharacterized protein n=1 Tax=Liparis tanakae TaxID=230148 RepID=A0A4Z2G3Z7_9TELE|nr:hypothetical protein EYF80_041769 [Liparis tanakae]
MPAAVPSHQLGHHGQSYPATNLSQQPPAVPASADPCCRLAAPAVPVVDSPCPVGALADPSRCIAGPSPSCPALVPHFSLPDPGLPVTQFLSFRLVAVLQSLLRLPSTHPEPTVSGVGVREVITAGGSPFQQDSNLLTEQCRGLGNSSQISHCGKAVDKQ